MIRSTMNISKTIQKLCFTDLEKGPAYTGTVLSCHLPQSDVGLCRTDMIKKYVQLLESGSVIARQNRSLLQAIYCGYYYQQLATYSIEKGQKNIYLESALKNWNTVIHQKQVPSDVRCYISLELGHIMQLLAHSWPQIEELYLSLFELSPERGESLEPIIRHYVAAEDYPIAYIFSSYTIEHHLFPETSISKWPISSQFRGWKVAELHIAVCESLGLFEEIKEINRKFRSLEKPVPA